MTTDNTKIFEKGKQLFEKKKYDAALKNFNSVIEKDPQFELAWHYKGRALYALGKFEEANRSIDKALELNSASAESWIVKTYLLLHFNKYEEALKCCNEIINIHPNKYWLLIAHVHAQFKHFEEALECAEKSLEYQPNDDRAQRVKSALLNAIHYGKYYYIPITRSALLNIIPVEDEIIYSTRLKMDWKVKFPRETPYLGYTILDDIFDGIFSDLIELALDAATSLAYGITYGISGEKDKGNLIMDAFITFKGIALYIPTITGQESGTTGLQYIPWNQVSYSLKGKMTIRNVFSCELVHEPKYESLESFRQRYDTFHEYIRDMRYQYTKICLENAKSYAKLEQDEKTLQWIEEGLKSNVYRPNFNLINDLMAVKSPILKKQKNKDQKMVRVLEDLVINHLKLNEGKAFILKVLLGQLKDKIENPNTYEYFKANSKGLLNKLTHNKAIKSTEKDGNMFYFF